MRRRIAVLSATVLVGGLLTPTGAYAQEPGGTDPASQAKSSAELLAAAKQGRTPKGPNPYLAFLPDGASADYAGWRAWMAAEAAERAERKEQQRAVAPTPLLVDEDEPAGTRGSNEAPATAQTVRGFGTGPEQNQRLRVLGTLSPTQAATEPLAPGAEDNGAISLATETGIDENLAGITTSGVIGDGPHGSAAGGTGDFDFYRFDVSAGDMATMDIDTPTGGELDSIIVLYDAAGEILDLNDDSSADSFDSLLTYQFTEAGTYYAMVTGYPVLPEDPTDPASGTGALSEGAYDLSISKLAADEMDSDFFAIRLRKGDVLGATVSGSAARLTVFDTAPREVKGSGQDASGIYPASSPLPGGGNAVVDHVAEEAGWHYVGVTNGGGDYGVTIEAFRPGLEGAPPVQTLFLDFDGARINTAIFGGPGVRNLSPLSAFLGRWGLTRADEDAVIDAIVATVEENLHHDMVESGLNNAYRIRIRNSRDHADPFGQENVSRVIVGGTIAESGIPTIGIAQSIDPGNFGTEESALTLLDVLSDPAGDDASLNTYLTEASDRIAFVGQAVGNVTAHEAGHFFGDFHVDQFNEQANIMDQGGNPAVMFGVGPDGVGGTADDVNVDFGEDELNPNEGFTGTEDTLSRIALTVRR